MFSLEEIAQITYNTMQLYFDQRKIDLAVGPISDDDANTLTRAYGDLNWEYYISTLGNQDDCFSLCIKFVTSSEHRLVESAPAGAAMSIFDARDKSLNIHIVENFVKDSEKHPLRRKMVLYTLYASMIFMNMAGSDVIRIHEPVEDKIDYYASFGFTMDPCGYIMSSNFTKLQQEMVKRAS
ncbi:hypothetical protein FBF90_04935 [Serratia marcescens]|uniref:hypothetical protein n=1 Tax=Serratia marcescens TaxID=615 RepID=UPI001150A34D|nr:hypothetical protein FBF84_04935 [Serratia marcescens]QDI22284.1 hypothetical protein FBF90_04935 [Serratia marcescens]